MKKRLVFSFVWLAFFLPAAYGDYADLYGSWNDIVTAFAEPNAGTTAFPILLMPSGGRFEGMGTSYTAVAAGPGLIQANPAGSAFEQGPAILISHHNWIADGALESVFFTTSIDPLGIGASTTAFFIPITGYDEYGEKTGHGYFFEFVGAANVSIQALSTRFFQASIGVNMKVAYRRIPTLLAPDQSAIGFPLDVGLLARIEPIGLSFAAVLKNFGQNVKGFDVPLPTTASFGISLVLFKVLFLSGDFNLPISFNPEKFPTERFDIATGFDLAVADFLSIRGGVKLKADNPKVTLGVALFPGKIKIHLNYNVNLMGDLRPSNNFSVAAELDLDPDV